MTRHVAAERLSAYVDDDLSERDAAVVRAHVAECADCRRAAAELRGLAQAARALDRPEPPPTLWSAIAGEMDAREAPRSRFWSWRATLLGAAGGGAAVAAAAWLLVGLGAVGGSGPRTGAGTVAAVAPGVAAGAFGHPGEGGAGWGGGAGAGEGTPVPASAGGADPLLVEAEIELGRAAAAYEQAVTRLRGLLAREQRRWDPAAQARVSERLARLEEAVAKERAAVRRDPGEAANGEMLLAAYRKQVDFLAEVVHRGSPDAEPAWR